MITDCLCGHLGERWYHPEISEQPSVCTLCISVNLEHLTPSIISRVPMEAKLKFPSPKNPEWLNLAHLEAPTFIYSKQGNQPLFS